MRACHCAAVEHYARMVSVRVPPHLHCRSLSVAMESQKEVSSATTVQRIPNLVITPEVWDSTHAPMFSVVMGTSITQRKCVILVCSMTHVFWMAHATHFVSVCQKVLLHLLLQLATTMFGIKHREKYVIQVLQQPAMDANRIQVGHVTPSVLSVCHRVAPQPLQAAALLHRAARQRATIMV